MKHKTHMLGQEMKEMHHVNMLNKVSGKLYVFWKTLSFLSTSPLPHTWDKLFKWERMNMASLGDTFYFPQKVAEEHYAILGTEPESSELKKHSWYSI